MRSLAVHKLKYLLSRILSLSRSQIRFLGRAERVLKTRFLEV